MRGDRGKRHRDRAVRVGRLPDAVPFAADLQKHDILWTVERQGESRSCHTPKATGGKGHYLSVLGTDRCQPFRLKLHLHAVRLHRFRDRQST